MTNNLKWIACNGVKPDLPEGTRIQCIYMNGYGCVGVFTNFRYSPEDWGNIVCYALDPVQELVEAAKELNEYPHRGDRWARIDAAIKAVEDMK